MKKKIFYTKLMTAFMVIALIAITIVCCIAYAMPNEDIIATATITSDSFSNKYPSINDSKVIIHSSEIGKSTRFQPLLNVEAKEFMYYIHIDANSTLNYTFLPLDVQMGKYIDEINSPLLQVIIKNQNKIGFNYVQNTNDIYSQNYVFNYDLNVELYDGVFDYYLVITNESISFCYYKTQSQGAYIPPTENRYEAALNNKAIEFYAGSEEYNYLINLFKYDELSFYYNFDLDDYYNEFGSFQTTQYYKEYVEFDIPPREGYTFLGLFYDEAFTQPYTGNPVKPLEELYQKWEINTYIITFDWRDEENWQYDTPINRTYNYGDVVDFVPEREFYGFLGWFDDATGEPFDGVVKSDMYLRGKWDKYNIIVTYVDTDLSVLKTEQIPMGGVAHFIPKKIGYKFRNWLLEGQTYDDFNTPLMKNTTLVANFEKIDCVVSFFINNNVYKVFSIDYDLPLSELLGELNIKDKHIAKCKYTDNTSPQQPINELMVTKDMRIDLSESYLNATSIEEIKQSFEANKKLVMLAFGGIGLIILMSIFGAIFGKKSKRRKR